MLRLFYQICVHVFALIGVVRFWAAWEATAYGKNDAMFEERCAMDKVWNHKEFK